MARRDPPSPPFSDLARARDFRPRPFRPAWWIPGPHAHTLAGKLLRPRVDPGVHRVRLDTPDGDFLLLDVGPEPTRPEGSSDGAATPEAPVGIVLHGLEGSSERSYVRWTMEALRRRGVRPVAMNFRSCGGEMNRRPRSYHSGETGDLAWVVEELARRFPNRPMGILGFSLGGNILLKYLGEHGDSVPRILRGAAAISTPFDLMAGTQALESGPMGRLYTYYFIRQLRQKVRLKAHLLEPLVEVEEVLRARTLREYDDRHTAPIHGFRDAQDYYERSSSRPWLTEIRLPTLLLQAQDDPFLPDGLPTAEVEANPHLIPGFTKGGGHVGFVEGAHPAAPSFWADEEAARFLAHVLEANPAEPLNPGSRRTLP